MSQPSMPPDNSLAVEQQRQQAARDAQAVQDKKDADAKTALAQLRTNAGTQGTQSANDYFTSQGLDPTQYSTDISSRIASTLAGISPDDPNPGASFANIGANIFNDAQTAYRTKNGRALDSIFPANFETSRVPLTLDDPYLASISSEQRSKADDIIKNMLSRGVITQTGFNSAESDLDKQTPGVNSRLGEVGTNQLTAEQGALRDIANKGRTQASTVALGSNFDPQSFGTEADSNFNDFIGKLSDSLRAAAPGNLFNTAGLAAIAGSGQGAQNTVFDPSAVAGIDTGTDPTKTTTPPKTAIF